MSEKRKHIRLTIRDKLEIIKKRENGESVSKLASEFGAGEQTVRDIIKNRSKIEQFVLKCDNAFQRQSVRGPKNERLDDAMMRWFSKQRELGTPISGPMIICKANYFCEKLNLQQSSNLSSGWLRRFKNRHGIRELSIQGERLSADNEAAKLFCADLAKIIEANNFCLDQIYNADETGLYWRAMPTRTLAASQERTAPGYKVSKDRVTVMCCANALGAHKLDLAMVAKSKSPRCLKHIKNLPVQYYNSKSCWMTRDIFQNWWENEFVPSTKKFLAENGLAKKAILLLDNAPSHPPAEKLSSENGDIFAVFLPPNVTSVIQPMDQGVIANMKKLYRKKLMLDLITEDRNPLTFWKSQNIKDAIFNISAAWNDVKTETIKRSFAKIVPSLNTPTDNNNPEDIVTVNELLSSFQAIPGHEAVDEENITQWLDMEKISGEDIAIQDEHFEEEQEESVEINTVSAQDALTAAKTLLVYFENKIVVDSSEILQIRKQIMKIQEEIMLEKRKN